MKLFLLALVILFSSCQKEDDIDCEYEVRRLNHDHVHYVNEQNLLLSNGMIDQQTFVYRVNAHMNFVEQSIGQLGCN
jgi:hypothetical protein